MRPCVDGPEIRARQRHVAQVLLELDPELQQQVQQQARDAGFREGLREARLEGRREGRLLEARVILRRLLAHRELTLSAEEDARIEACADLATLEQWHDKAIGAASAAEALR